MRDRLLGKRVSPTPTQKTDDHSRPLARWTVSSLTESAAVGRGDVEAVALVVLGREVGQQGRQRHVAVDGLELRDRLDEQVEVVASRGRGGRGGRGELDVDAGGVDDAAHDIEQRVADVGAQPPQLGGQEREALERLGRVRSLARRLDGVAERGQLGGVDAVGDLEELVGDRGGLPATAARRRCRRRAGPAAAGRAGRSPSGDRSAG